MMHCPSCGAGHPVNTLFCDECGFALTAAGRDGASGRPAAAPRRGAADGAAGMGPVAPHTRTTSPGSSGPSTSPEQPAPGPRADTAPFIVRLVSRDDKTRYECPLLTELLIGRAGRGGKHPDIDLTNLKAVEQGVSRRHARIVRAGDDAALEDLNSLNGTFIAGHRLAPGHPEVIRPGDVLQFGKIILVVSR